MSYINHIGTATPNYKSEQMEIYNYMVDSIPFNERERKVLRYLYKKSGIAHRHSVLSDFSSLNGREKLYTSENGFSPKIEKRLAIYNETSGPLAYEAIGNCLSASRYSENDFTHLITVSCTGMSAPGLDTEIISHFKLNKNIQRFNITFMGCFAAINGLKLADTICRAHGNAKVLLVCVELCTLHFQNVISDDYNLSNMLFGDGAAAVVITGSPNSDNSLKIHSFHSDINSDGEHDMSWNISSQGFLMKLSSYVPQLLNIGFKTLIDKVLGHYDIHYEDLNHWAIHPGGKRILDNIEKEFNLENNQLKESREVLANYGNMSSPTILFVLKEMMTKYSGKKNQYIFTAAFGPGLTTETALLSYEK
jgi:predicted naringenin-chalcone synthase